MSSGTSVSKAELVIPQLDLIELLKLKFNNFGSEADLLMYSSHKYHMQCTLALQCNIILW